VYCGLLQFPFSENFEKQTKYYNLVLVNYNKPKLKIWEKMDNCRQQYTIIKFCTLLLMRGMNRGKQIQPKIWQITIICSQIEVCQIIFQKHNLQSISKIICICNPCQNSCLNQRSAVFTGSMNPNNFMVKPRSTQVFGPNLPIGQPIHPSPLK